ncbi:exodeoxyribonuclease VII small subunit [Acetobacteraceae bacterium ESL0709]|nr:exodeoxyribonuclease VII small subunit [Acetobacteraceae bacterium ESL0697]MDF7678530.1 exodeoxyribonuclease VII small subunit [Acetobacteraceae bacterium ESL0709]
MSQPSQKSLKSLSFEDALSELERIVRDLEGGQLTLEKAIAAYERGAELRQLCETRLGEAEMRVKAIVQKNDGSRVTEDLTSTLIAPEETS